MAASIPDKYSCGEGDDCPCHHLEARRVPAVPKCESRKVPVEAGQKIWLCVCGESKNYPYCDGSHKAYNEAHGTTFAPNPVEMTETKDVYLCQCGHSPAFPFCNGTHKKVHGAAKE
jgi:CDGSH-type Zn-finger protein